jgi:MoaA/NifB/PqqE/SkfB family radical SAM enzyme
MTVTTAPRGSPVLRQSARRLIARAVRPRRRSPLDRPIGVKLELTHRCNLRCGFCFTDSPRRTLEGTPDISDEAWLRVAEDAIAAGVIEAVVTGGEPLLRMELALSIIETFAEAGVAVSLVTNGWFVDEAVADRIAAIDDVRVHVSVDGASPQVHDAVRGVPGSWRRAVRAIDLLLARGVPVQVNHTISSANAATLRNCLEHLWLLGPGTIGTATVVPIGAASRAREWQVDAAVMHREIQAFRRRGFSEVALAVSPPQGLPRLDRWAPAAMLVRPDGTVLIDSVHPFSFGSIDDGLATVWERIRQGASEGALSDWRREARSGRRLAEASVVPYRDEPVEVAGSRPPAQPGRPRRGGELMTSPPDVAPDDLAEARAVVEGLALGRRYRLEDVRWTGSAQGERYVRVKARRRTVCVNATTGIVMDACGPGTPGDGVAALAARHPSVPRERLVRDTLVAVRRLERLGVLAPAGG